MRKFLSVKWLARAFLFELAVTAWFYAPPSRFEASILALTCLALTWPSRS